MSEAGAVAVARERELFRWAGSKKHLIEKVQPLVEAHRAATGGGLVSFCHGRGDIERACGGAYVAADKSPELLALFADLKMRGPSNVHHDLDHLDKVLPREPWAFKALGRKDYDDLPISVGAIVTEAARFLWLSAFCLNGIWRVNSRGIFNQSICDAKRFASMTTLPPLESFIRFAAQIAHTRFVEGWENALRLAERGDVLLVDPPYGEFDGYCAGGFGSRDHRLLASALREAVEKRGLGVIAFNAPEAEGIYYWAKCEPVTRPGNVSSDGDGRQRVSELIITAGLKA